MDIKELRKSIDEVDCKIVALYEERMAICEGIAKYKIENDLPVFDGKREEEKLEAVASLLKDDIFADDIKELYKLLMNQSKKHQKKMIDKEA